MSIYIFEKPSMGGGLWTVQEGVAVSEVELSPAITKRWDGVKTGSQGPCG